MNDLTRPTAAAMPRGNTRQRRPLRRRTGPRLMMAASLFLGLAGCSSSPGPSSPSIVVVTTTKTDNAGDGAAGSGSAVTATPGNASTTPQTSEGQPSTPETSVSVSGKVPVALLGKWSGTTYPSPGVQASVEVTIVQGDVGETVEHSSVTYTYISLTCTGQGVLASASTRQIVVTNSSSSTNSMCSGLEASTPVQVTYRLNTSGTMQASVGTTTAELTKQS